jgi:hypothetical protein
MAMNQRFPPARDGKGMVNLGAIAKLPGRFLAKRGRGQRRASRGALGRAREGGERRRHVCTVGGGSSGGGACLQRKKRWGRWVRMRTRVCGPGKR